MATPALRCETPGELEAASSAIACRARPRPVLDLLWLFAAIGPMLMSEILRLAQTDALAWIAYDYAGRIVALALLAAVPTARRAAFSRGQARIASSELAFWVIGLVAFDRVIDHPVSDYINAILPGTGIGHYPSSHGLLFAIDISFGLALVAYSEEVIFRRCAREVLAGLFGDQWAMTIVSAMLFAGYHWWTGIGNIAATMLFGVLAMLFYRRAGLLWPVVLSHYCCDVINFA